MAKYSKTAEKLLPHLLQEMQQVQPVIIAAGGGGAMAVHDIAGAYHSGTLDESQAPWAVTTTTFGLHEADPDAHHNRATVVAPVAISGQQISLSYAAPLTVSGSNLALSLGHGVEESGGSLRVKLPTNSGIVRDSTGFYLQPSTLTVATTNSLLSGAHAHAITTTTAGTPSTIVALDSSGYTTAARWVATDRVRTPLIDTASGNLTLQPAGDIILDPTDSNVLPGGSIQDDLGDYNRKWRTLYAAELYVETLVAQDVLATIGGRVMVAPTTTLIADAGSGATTIDVKHNNLSNGSFVYLSTAPGGIAQVEVMKVTSSASSITGGYRYSVTRNIDGSGANNWVSGDAVVNLGSAVGQGYIDLTSTSTVHSHLGPTIAIYSRTATTNWNDTKAVVALGNLRSFVSYSSDEFGLAVGNDLTLQPTTGFKGFTADRTNGMRLFNAPVSIYNGSNRESWLSQYGLIMRTGGTGSIIRFAPDINAEADPYDYARIQNTQSSTENALAIIAYDSGSPYPVRDARLSLRADNAANANYASITIDATSTGSTIALMAETSVALTAPSVAINGGTAWHSGNDGSGSGLDADKLDTYEATAFALLAGRAGGQLLNGGTASGDDLYLDSTAHATKGDILLAPNGGNVSIGNGIYAAGATLEITKSGYTTLGPTVRLNNNSAGGVGDAARMEYYNAGSLRAYLEWQVVSGGAAKWLFYDALNTATRMEIGGDGLVNIGAATNTYSAKLAVNGNVHAYGGVVTADDYLQVKTRSGSPGGASGFGRIYYDSGDDKLKYISSGGTVRTLSYT